MLPQPAVSSSLRAALGLVALAAFALSPTAQAAPYTATYTSTVENSFYDGVVSGDEIAFIVTMDNGGSSNLSQTWELSDIQTIQFIANGGVINVTFDLSVGYSEGSFVSDSSGNLTSVAEFGAPGAGLSNAISSNIAAFNYNFFINGGNAILYTDNFSSYLTQNDVAGNQVASNWTLAAVPEPTTAGLLALGSCAVLFGWRKRR